MAEMKIYRVQDERGVVHKLQGPVGMTEQEVLAEAEPVIAASRAAYTQRARSDEAAFQASIKDPTKDTSFVENMLAGIGKRMTDYARGARQAVSFGDRAEALRAEERDRERRDAPLANSGGGMLGSALTDTGLAMLPMGVLGAVGRGAGIAAGTARGAMPALTSVAGQAAVGGAQGFLEPSTDAWDAAIKTGRGAAFGAGGQWLGNRVGAVLTPKVITPKQQLAADMLKRHGYVVHPADIDDGMVTSVLSKFAGKELPGQVASRANTAVTTGIARDVANLKPQDALTEAVLAARRGEEGLAYKAVEKAGPYNWTPEYYKQIGRLGKPGGSVLPSGNADKVDALVTALQRPSFTGKQMVETIKGTRDAARDASRQAAMIGGTDERALAGVYTNAEKALEALAAKNLKLQGKPALVAELRNARKEIAKLHTISDMLHEGSQTVSPQVALRLRNSGSPLSGGLDDIATMAETFPKSMRELDQMGAPGTNALLTNMGALAGGHAGSTGASGGAAAATSLIPWLREPFADLITSPAYQKLWANPATSVGGKISKVLTGTETAKMAEMLRNVAGPAGIGAGQYGYDKYNAPYSEEY